MLSPYSLGLSQSWVTALQYYLGIISLVFLFSVSRALRLLALVIPEEFVTQTKTQVQSIGSAVLCNLPDSGDDTSWPVQRLGKIVAVLYLVPALMRSGLYMMPHLVWAAMGFGLPAKLRYMGSISHIVGIVVGCVLVPGVGPVGSGLVLPRSRREDETSHVLDPRHVFH
jgi:hypothetical protein